MPEAWYLLARREGTQQRLPIVGPLPSRESVDALVWRADRVLMDEGVKEAFYRALEYETALLRDYDTPGRFNAAFGITEANA